MITHDQKRRIVRSLVWDYDVREDMLLDVLLGLREKEGPFDQERIFLRALERLPWHDILEIMGKERIIQLLTPQRIAKLRFPGQRRRYERIRKILRGEPVSLSGWNAIDLENVEDRRLKELRHRLEDLLGRDGFRMIMFGSRARGDYSEDSDLDVAVIVRDLTRKTKIRILEEVADFELDYLLPISALVISEDDFNHLKMRERRIAFDIEREGIPL
jgi:predicted nucleotidyltransferase